MRLSRRRMPDLRTETMTVNMGPQHPSTHGVLRLVLELDGETVLSASPTIGYLHTGIEKTAEQKKWQQVIPLVERMDYLSAQSNSMAFCLSVEKLLGLEVPERVQRIRVLHRRAAAHQQPSRLARHARHGSRRRVGDALLLPRARAAAQHQRDARRLPDVPELHARRRPARGSAARLPRGGARVPRSLSAEARRVRGSADEERDLPEADARRRRASPTEDAVAYGLVGPIARAAGVAYDVRKVVPVPRLRDVRVRGADADRRRRLRALPGARRRDARERQDLPAGARAHLADRRLCDRRSADHAAAEGSRLHRDGGAHSALPDLLAGLHRAGRRGVCAGRRSARRARLLRRRPTAPTGRGASSRARRRCSPARRSRR